MKKYAIFILVVCWLGFIFYQGSRQTSVSYSNSDMVVEPIMYLVRVGEKFFHLTINEAKVRYQVSYYIRKCAHIFEYGLLASMLAIAFNYLKCSKLNVIVYSLFLTLLCANLDEFYQSFIGRTSSVRDVMIDFSGAIIGVVIVVSISKIRDIEIKLKN